MTQKEKLLTTTGARTGSILFGAVDKSKYEGELVALPVPPTASTGKFSTFWVVLDSIGLADSRSSETIAGDLKTLALPDSGSTNMVLPSKIAKIIAGSLGVQNDNLGNTFLPCDAGQKFDDDQAHLPFGFGNVHGPKIKVPISELILPLAPEDLAAAIAAGSNVKNDTAICSWRVVTHDGKELLLGDAFMRSASLVSFLTERGYQEIGDSCSLSTRIAS